MATKKGASKKGGAKKGASKKGGAKKGAGLNVGTVIGAVERVAFDRATAQVAEAVKRAVAGKPTLSKLKNPIIVGIWYNPRTRQVEIINQLEQF